MLHIVARSILAPGMNAITADRSFIVYPIVCMAVGADLVRVPCKDNGFDLDRILAAITASTRAILIANPNNPTGSLLSPADLDRFLDRVPNHVLVVLDEAYADFAEAFARQRGVEYSHSLDYVRQGRSVVVLRTFSKAQGLAAARVGYAIAPAELIQYFMRVKTVFSVSSVAEAGALAGLRDAAHVQKTVENNCKGAEYLTRKIAEMGLKALPTWTNFLYVDLDEPASPFAKRLEAEGVIVRPMTGNWNAPTAIRVTIGTPEQNELFVSAMKKVMSSAAVR
jgi:histidinol-phosphate aminotransferase